MFDHDVREIVSLGEGRGPTNDEPPDPGTRVEMSQVLPTRS
jgi:hypothetical protein